MPPSSTCHHDPRTIAVSLPDGSVRRLPPGRAVCTLLDDPVAANGLHILGALVNNDAVSLSFPLEVDSQVAFLTMADHHGWRIYRHSAAFLLAKAVLALFPDARFAVEHSIGPGFFCSFERNGSRGITEEQLAALEARMRTDVEADQPILRRKLSFAEALQAFEEPRQKDKYNLLRYRNPPSIAVYGCEGFTDLAHGPLASSTGALGQFRLHHYPPGFVIQFPDHERAPAFSPFEQQPHLFSIFTEHKAWGEVLGIRTVGDLNRAIAERTIDDVVRMSEALHEKKIARLADDIADRPGVTWILIAGPSSSGKTTLAKRLGVQLRVNGVRPASISVDDYFVDRDQTPLDEDGQYDFEHLETLDLDLLNEHLRLLDAGEEVALPRFNFARGVREFRGDTLRVAKGEVVILEGIHALNPRLTERVPDAHKYRIYISALTQLNLDAHNRISTTDNRLLRRLVRDNTFRGNDALTTLRMWPSVRRGEKRWIFPFQQEADVAFNSALDYELAVLRPLAEPLLAQVKPFHEEYAEARRLQAFLSAFLTSPPDLVPAASILREYIGDSSFRY